MKIAFIPIDNRPVCYTLPKIIAGIDNKIELSLPPREFLGDLNKIANISGILEWLKQIGKQDIIILSLDTLVYGGLIPSRRCSGNLEEFKPKLQNIKEVLIKSGAKIYATSSIMRISNNNVNQEEKEYWSLYGEKIFKYSYEMSKNGSAKTDVPQEILDDYLKTRKRNFEINKIYLTWQKEKIFDTLIFSKDDCAQYGFNVDEANELKKFGGHTKTGADEIPLTLLAKAITDRNDKTLKICPIFLEPEYKELISNYEDISIEKSVTGQIELAGCEVSDEKSADILLYINNFIDKQGEIVMKIPTKMFEGNFVTPQRPYMIADVRFANGADNNFVDELFKNKFVDENFYGYSAWNTSANTLGSLICGAVVKFYAKDYNKELFKKLQITRFLDDWAYQANVRQQLTTPDKDKIGNKIKPFEKIVADKLNTSINVSYTFPWQRLFEIEII